MIEGSRRLGTSTLLMVSLLALGMLLRLIFLDSDPDYDKWLGYVVDEGRWTELARELVLFGSPDLDSGFSRLHLILAPAYQAITAVFFAALGVGFTSARLVSALSGIGLLIGATLFLRERFSTEGLFVTVLALALQPDLLFLSRVAIPETAAMLFEFLAFALLLSKPCSAKRAFGAGLLSGMVLALKATAAPIVPILAGIVLLVHRGDDKRSSLRRLGAYAAGLAVPALVALAAGALLLRSGADLRLASALSTLLGTLRVNSPYFALSTLFYPSYAPALHAFLLPAWAIAGILIAVGRTPPHPARVVYLGSATWVVGWLLVASTLEYFPARYVYHVLVPLAINVGAGLTLLQALGRNEIAASVGVARGVKGAITAMWLALPLAVLLSPIVLTLAHFGGLDVERLRVHLPTVLLVDLVLAGAQAGRSRRGSVRFALVVLPLVFAPLWFIGVHIGVFPGGFWAYGISDTVGKSALLAIAAAVTAMIYGALDRGGIPRGCGYAYSLLFAGLWLAQVPLRLMAPSYTMVEASSAVGDLVDDSTLVGTHFAATVFLGNRLRYTENQDRVHTTEILVRAFSAWDEALAEGYRLVDVQLLHGKDTLRIYRRER